VSWEATAYVKGVTHDPHGAQITRTEKMVMFVLSDCINAHSGQGWVSLDVLAQEALISRRGLLNTLARLEQRDLVRKLPQATAAGRTRPNLYVFPQMPLQSSKGEATSPLPQAVGDVAKLHHGGGRVKPDFTLEGEARLHPEGEAITSPLSSLDPLKDPKKEKDTLSGRPDRVEGGPQDLVAQAEGVLALLNEATGMRFAVRHPNGELTANGRLAVGLLRKGYSVDQLERVVRLKCRAWLGTEMARFLRPKTLFGPTNFAQYVAGLAPASVQTVAGGGAR
jgi:uncharacterized phage protein (TIGR02220 family)